MMHMMTTTRPLLQSALLLAIPVGVGRFDAHSLSKLLMTMKMKVKSMMSMK